MAIQTNMESVTNVLSSDSAIWNRFRNGEKSAFEEIYQNYFDILCKYGHRLTSDKLVLEDAIHDVFIELWRRREFLSEIRNLKFYLFKALRNQIFRSNKLNIMENSESIDDFLDYLISISAEQDSVAMENHLDQTKIVNHAIAKLSPRQQEVIHLRFFQGFGLEETALLMGLSKQSVSNLLFKSYAVLRLTLKFLSSFPIFIFLF